MFLGANTPFPTCFGIVLARVLGPASGFNISRGFRALSCRRISPNFVEPSVIQSLTKLQWENPRNVGKKVKKLKNTNFQKI